MGTFIRTEVQSGLKAGNVPNLPQLRRHFLSCTVFDGW
jgi:hypothetical protein